MTLPEHTNPPGKSNATASLVLGIIAVVFWFFGYSSILSVILGIVGLIQASKDIAPPMLSDSRKWG